MTPIELTDLESHPLAKAFATLTEAQLRSKADPSQAMFIAESPKVIKVAIQAGMTPVAILCERKHIAGDAAEIIRMAPEAEILTGSRTLLQSLTGYKLTRGVLCAMKRPSLPVPSEILEDARHIAVIDGVTDTTNIGAIFRSAAALGIDAVLLTPTSCDPLNRRAVRVSMGSVFLIPWTYLETPVSYLRNLGFTTVAMALSDNSIPLDSPLIKEKPKLALVLGTEGDGLAPEVISEADYTVRIPMFHGVDSLNVAAASAVAFWELRPDPLRHS